MLVAFSDHSILLTIQIAHKMKLSFFLNCDVLAKGGRCTLLSFQMPKQFISYNDRRLLSCSISSINFVIIACMPPCLQM
jgi:hypothetical protein